MSEENLRTRADLEQRQSLPLQAKILMTKQRIREWYDYWEGDVYVSFSGGKDSTVLKHIVDSMYSDVPAVFVNTGLEYPQIQMFVRDVKAGKYDCFNSDVEILRPEMRFDEVLKTYGYPVISKEISKHLYYAKQGRYWAIQYMNGKNTDGTPCTFKQRAIKYNYILDAPFNASHMCCQVMKKKPAKKYEKETKRKPFIGTLAEQSSLRTKQWIKNGCNSFDSRRQKSEPMSVWTEQDVLHYIKKYHVPYSTIYGDIVLKQENGSIANQMSIIDGIGQYSEEDVLKVTGRYRTGCMFCMFGVHIEKEPNRFQTMKETHPKQYEYCMNQLGLKQVLEYIGVPYE